MCAYVNERVANPEKATGNWFPTANVSYKETRKSKKTVTRIKMKVIKCKMFCKPIIYLQ